MLIYIIILQIYTFDINTFHEIKWILKMVLSKKRIKDRDYTNINNN